MPIVQIEMIEGRTIEQKRKLVSSVTEAICNSVDCPKEAVRIIIREMKKENIAAAGKLYTDR
ncbi:MAG: 4-oxalocrotonate tautomerase [Thermosediminibacterales bacterium]|nr:4-oxalocrotonate tautomerase [Thermosediminibacterales bacterium]